MPPLLDIHGSPLTDAGTAKRDYFILLHSEHRLKNTQQLIETLTQFSNP
jgi:hypothetical protein